LILCTAVFYLHDRDKFYWTYRCWRLSATPSTCLKNRNFEFEADLYGIRYRGSTENLVDRHVFFYGAFEKPILFFLRDTMNSVYSNKGIFLDIGANTGAYSLFMSKYATEIHAFEPWRPVLEKFQYMVNLNGIKNIVLHGYGLGDQNSKQPFFKPPADNLGTGSFVASFKDNNTYDGELEIQIGDDALKRAGLPAVALVKMDIEGYEKPALKGLRQTLETHRPIVEFELSVDPKSPVSVKSQSELISLFPGNYEFAVFVLKKDDAWTGAYLLKPAVEILQFDKPDQYDLVAYPAEKKKHIPLKGPRF
jgi:FkbM family methyltransferase